jgi:AcrR family transcriptional regulator
MSETPNGNRTAAIETTAGEPSEGRVALRRKRTEAEIVAAAWDLVHEHGLASLSMRDLGDRVGMKAQSLYSYFASKNDIYDAMFREGQIAFAAATTITAADLGGDESPEAGLRLAAHRFFEFCTVDFARYQLMFQRIIPDFVPSQGSYELAVESLERARERVRLAGFDPERDLDLWTALQTGLVDQQISNDPGGTRWQRLIDDAIDMFFAFATARTATRKQMQ